MMQNSKWTAVFALIILGVRTMLGAAGIAAPNVTVGEGLEVIANVTLDEPAPPAGLEITLASGDPTRLLFSATPEGAGSATLKLSVRGGYRGSPDYYIQGFGRKGTLSYTVSAPGFSTGSGAVTLAPSGMVVLRSGMGVPKFLTTTGSGTTALVLYSALLDEDLNYVQPQPVAGGRMVNVSVVSSDVKVGTVSPGALRIAGGSANAGIEFRPIAAGETTISVSTPRGFTRPAGFASISAIVVAPGIAVTDDVSIGNNLQTGGAISLGEPAPAGGLVVTLTSNDPAKLLLSSKPDHVGSDCIHLAIPPGGTSAHYYLQALSGTGVVTYTATAPAFRGRTGTVTLTPSGVVLGGPQGPPDEAELLNKDIAEGPHGFVTSLAAHASTVVTAYAVQLDPVTHRGADLTVQQARPGVAIHAVLNNSNPAAGTVRSAELTIPGGASAAATQFTPAAVGTTVISVATPAGYTRAGNSTALTIIVKD